MRSIDADELLDQAWFCDLDHWSGRVVDEDIINEAPTLDVAPVVHACWEHGSGDWDNILGEYYLRPTYICSNCHEEEKRNSAYCPNCGAKMDLEESNEDC